MARPAEVPLGTELLDWAWGEERIVEDRSHPLQELATLPRQRAR